MTNVVRLPRRPDPLQAARDAYAACLHSTLHDLGSDEKMLAFLDADDRLEALRADMAVSNVCSAVDAG